MAANVQELLAAANATVKKIQPGELKELLAKDNVVVIDVRDTPELQKTGKVRGAVHIPRGMLEFRADATTPYHDPKLQKDRTVVLYCASGGRSALAGKTLQDMGYTSVLNAGGIQALIDADVATEPVS